MSTFELNSFSPNGRGDHNFTNSFGNNRDENNSNNQVAGVECDRLNPRRLREECIIAFKVYDSCRQQNCNILLH